MNISSALVINLGLLDGTYLSAMKTAAEAAKRLGKPIVLDPVGAGASKLRDETCREMIELTKPDIIRGNMSEIRALTGGNISSKGVDASDDDAVNETNRLELGELVRGYAEKTGSVVCATGAVDIVSDGVQVFYLKNGHDMLCDVTGTGCMCSAMTGAAAAAGEPLAAAIAAVVMPESMPMNMLKRPNRVLELSELNYSIIFIVYQMRIILSAERFITNNL